MKEWSMPNVYMNLVLKKGVLSLKDITVKYLHFALISRNQKFFDNFQISPRLDKSAVTPWAHCVLCKCLEAMQPAKMKCDLEIAIGKNMPLRPTLGQKTKWWLFCLVYGCAGTRQSDFLEDIYRKSMTSKNWNLFSVSKIAAVCRSGCCIFVIFKQKQLWIIQTLSGEKVW